MPVEQWRRQFEVNLIGQVAVTRALLWDKRRAEAERMLSAMPAGARRRYDGLIAGIVPRGRGGGKRAHGAPPAHPAVFTRPARRARRRREAT